MASKLVPDLLTNGPPLDWRKVERAYAGMSQEQLLTELTRINEALARQTRSVVTANIQQVSGLDQPVVRSPRMDALSRPADHEARRSQPSKPTALDLLISGRRMGPRLAQKLAAASARAARGNR